jgi:hypothetical protein
MFLTKEVVFLGITHGLINSISRKAWIIDSGATDHIICDKSLFSRIDEELNFPISVQLPNGNISHIRVTGTVNLSPQIILKNVLYVPEFQFNLIYVSKVCQENSCRVIFNADTCLFQALSTDRLMGWGNISE